MPRGSSSAREEDGEEMERGKEREGGRGIRKMETRRREKKDARRFVLAADERSGGK